jgi:hypothetical protein
MSEAVQVVIDGYPAGHQFHGNALRDDVVQIFPDAKDMYVDTILRMGRRHRRTAFRTINQNDSLYEKVASVPILDQMKAFAKKDDEMGKKKCNARPALQIDLF